MANNFLEFIQRKLSGRFLLIICGLFALVDTFAFGLTDLDEGDYSSVARGMVHSANYIIPKLNGHPWFEKPPFLYWMMSGSMKLFGFSELAARIPSVLAFWAVLAILVIWGNRRLGEGIGTKAALIFALTPLPMMLGRMAYTDMLLTCFFVLALVAMWETARKPLWSIVWGVAMGLAVLTKGPIGLGLMGLQGLIAFSLLRKQGFKLRWAFAAVGISFLVLIPWYAAVLSMNGRAFFNDFIIHQNIQRFLGGDKAHAVHEPVMFLLFYVGVIWLGFFPFSVLVPARGKVSPVNAYLRRWCWLVFGFFTLSTSKLPSYILPMLPTFALVIADAWFGTGKQKSLSMMHRLWLIIGTLILVAGSAALAYISRSPMTILFGIGFAAVSIPLIVRGTGKSAYPVHPAAALILLVGLHLALGAFDNMALRPARSLAMSTPPAVPLVVYKFPLSLPSLYFYRGNSPVVFTDNEADARKMLANGAYCLSTAGKQPSGRWHIIRSAKDFKKKYILFSR